MRDDTGWAAFGQAKVLLLGQNTVQPGKGITGFAAKGTLWIDALASAQHARRRLGGSVVDFEERKKKRVYDVAVEAKGGKGLLAALVGVEGTEAAIQSEAIWDTQ